uniref:Uncharacterized protein n=1 Tax=Rhizophora mucronata TaxID=61149 RepID=A0A2P2QRK5_RHIMU
MQFQHLTLNDGITCPDFAGDGWLFMD